MLSIDDLSATTYYLITYNEIAFLILEESNTNNNI